MRLKWGAGICSPDPTRTIVWRPPFAEPRGMRTLQPTNKKLKQQHLCYVNKGVFLAENRVIFHDDLAPVTMPLCGL